MSSQVFTSGPILNLQDVTKSYQLGTTSVQALVDVSLQIQRGGIVALMGPSGSGKSTILNLFGALDQPSTGAVHVDGREISRLGKDEQADFRNATIGFVFQNFNLIPVLTTLENVVLPAQLGQSKVQDSEERAKILLEKVGLGKQLQQSVNKLSGGQMQRVAIARALINKPQIILADEPTANLDHKTSEKVLAILRDLCNQEQATVVVATHDRAVLPWCDRMITLHDGKVASDEILKSSHST